MQSQIEIVCKCPDCERVYRQTVTAHWGGASRKVPPAMTALRALCEEAGQGRDDSTWVGYAYCSECSLRRCPPALGPALGAWLTKGEYL